MRNRNMSRRVAICGGLTAVSAPFFPRAIAAKTDFLDIADIYMKYSHAFGAKLNLKFMGYGYRAASSAGNKPFKVVLGEMKYQVLTPIMKPSIIATSTYRNNTDAQGSEQFSNSKTTTSSASWTLTKGISTSNGLTSEISKSQTSGSSLSQTATFSAGFNFFASASASAGITHSSTDSLTEGSSQSHTMSKSINLSDASAQTTTEAQTWSWNTNIPVPARSRVDANVVVQEAKVSTGFKIGLRFSGTLWFAFPNAPNRPFPVDLVNWFDSRWELSIRPPPVDFSILRGSDPEVEMNLEGVFNGVRGVNYVVEVDQYSLKDGQKTKITLNPGP